MNEKRLSDRTPANIAGRLMTASLNVPCTILDVSPTGARVQVEPGLFLPKHVSLRARDLGADRVAQVVWRNKTQLGLRF